MERAGALVLEGESATLQIKERPLGIAGSKASAAACGRLRQPVRRI